MGKFRGSQKDYYYLDLTERKWERKRHFFPLAVRNAVAEVISAKNWKETVPLALGSTQVIPKA